MLFEFATATQILFGSGRVREVPGLVQKLGERPLLVNGRSLARSQFLLDALSPVVFSVTAEPTVATIQEGVAFARAQQCDCVVSFGGGAVLDAGKAIAALLTNEGEPLDYLEVVGRGLALQRPSAPFVAIPTTAGTGAEVTSNAVLGVGGASSTPQTGQKVSLRSPFMLPRVAVVDPELTLSLPPAITASTGLDALTQLIEPYLSNKANPLTDALCAAGIPRVARALRRAYQNGDDLAAREEMALGSLFGGLALANAKLGAVHGFAGPIGGMFPAPHGAVCARLLPLVMAANLHALQSRQADSPTLKRFDEVGQWLTGEKGATAVDGVSWLETLVADLAIPSLRTYGLTANDIEAVVVKSQSASSMKGNPIVLTREELTAVLQKA